MSLVLERALQVKNQAEDMLLERFTPQYKTEILKIIKDTRDIIKQHGGRLLILICLSLLTGCHKKQLGLSLCGEKVSTSTDVTKRQIFVMLGHSNMSGRGQEASSYSQDSRIIMLNAANKWTPAQEPTDYCPGGNIYLGDCDNAGVSPGMAFANEMLKHNSQLQIGLINCSKGGSTVESWQYNQDDSLFANCRDKINTARAEGQIAGVLIALGENDSAYANEWASKFTRLARDLRGAVGDSMLPIVFSQVSSTLDLSFCANRDMVRAQQASVSAHDLTMISSEGLATWDGVHFTTGAQEELGRRFAQGFIGD